MRSRWLLGALAAAALAVPAGCGGDDEAPIEPIDDGSVATDSEPADQTISRREFISAADVRCAEANAAVADLDQNLEIAATQERGITRGVLQALRDLGEPPDPDGSLERFLDGLEEQVSILRRREQAAGSDPEAYDALAGELAQAKADARLAAEDYGFESCGQEGAATAEPGEPVSPPANGGVEPAPPAPAPTPAPAPPPDSGGAPPANGGGGGGGGGSGGISPG
jgi:hypothetical protein